MLAHQITKEFERAVGDYTGSPYVVAVNSCSMALLLAIAWHLKPRTYLSTEQLYRPRVEIPRHTYVSVPMSIIQAGGRPRFRDEDWSGSYQLKPLPVFDSARRFTSGMYRAGQFQCVSFHVSKILVDTQGGAILHDDPKADIWFRKARFDGRTEGVKPKDDYFDTLGYHCYLSPDVAARLLWKLSFLPRHNPDLPSDDYPDLSEAPVFQ